MDQDQITQKEENITVGYRSFLDKVRDAFNHHCDEIKDKAMKKFDEIPEDDQDGRRKILENQKVELDKTLSELKHLLAKKGDKVRKELEELAQIRDEQSFNLDDELGEIAA